MTSSRTLRLLIVDDDVATLDALSETLVLRMHGCQVDACDGAHRALEQLAANDYDAVISDVKMPGMDGIEMLSHVRRLAPDVPVMLITGHGQTDLAIQALRAGAFDLIQKPLDRDYVIAGVSRAVETRDLRRLLQTKQAALVEYARVLEQRVEERTAELRTALRTKDEFLGLITHELRTPLAVIFGNIEMLHTRADRMDEESKVQAMADLRQETRRLLRIVENLLILARMEYEADRALPVPVITTLRTQIELQRQLAPNRQLRVQLPPEPLSVLADTTHVEMVLSNLLGNAEKYSPADEAIDIFVVQDAGEVVISVCDRGAGVDENEVDLIFEPFYRSRASSSSKPGVGVGLAV
jgi:signal transduction histidine kinase